MRAATDAAAWAGTEALARLDSQPAAIQAAIDIAAAYKLNGASLVLNAKDIREGGQAVKLSPEMPAFKDKLTAQETDSLLIYLRVIGGSSGMLRQ